MRQLLVEKYRPKTITDFVFQDENTKKRIKKIVDEGEFPNLLLAGPPGCGKSSLAMILIKEAGIQKTDVYRINASLTNGIGFIREELMEWVKKSSFSKFKVVLLEEGTQLTQQAQKALLDVTESYSDRVRFIMTGNYPKALIPALLSRFPHIQMGSFPDEDILDIVLKIVAAEGIEVENDEALLSHIDAYKPDLRKIINSIDAHLDDDNTLLPLTAVASSKDVSEWMQAWNSEKLPPLEELLELAEVVDQNNFESIYEVMYENSYHFPDIATGVVALSQYLDRAYRCANQRLHLSAFLYQVFEVEVE